MSNGPVSSIDRESLLKLVPSVGLMKPNKVKPENAKEVKRLDDLLDSDKYVMERKIDGCRYKLFGHYFFSADNVEKTNNMPHLRNFFEALAMHNLILDGEINFPGKTSQYVTHVTGASAQNAVSFQEDNGWVHYTIYDILRTPRGNWLLNNTYAERRKLLEHFYTTFVKDTELAPYIHIVDLSYKNKRDFLAGILAEGGEGGVLKDIASQYHMGKKPMWRWMKFKQNDDTDLVVMGFQPATVLYNGSANDWPYWKEVEGVLTPVTKFHYMGWIGKVVLGAYVNGILTQICTASGMTEAVRKHMSEEPEAYIGKVARVNYMEKTEAGFPRHPGFVNMHEDKKPEECTWEMES